MRLLMDAVKKSLIEAFTVLRKNKAVSEPHRFMIMLVLLLNGEIEFTKLQRLLSLTPGNLDHHIRKLINTGHVTKEKIYSCRLLTIITITSKGMEAFINYSRMLKILLNQANPGASLSMVTK
ncbi:MAG: transcriptional regulator [Candidatus Odinarchaeota archaeon]